MRHLPLLLLLALAACPPGGTPEAGADAEVPVPCDGPAGCVGQGLDQACRQARCLAQVPCGDDLECGLGERCVAGQCRFRGCRADADCATGRCRAGAFACVECGADQDCPRDRPSCDPATNACVACRADAQCPPPGPGHCAPEGRCVDCLSDEQCPSGLRCGADRRCTGAGPLEGCALGTSCAAGLACVTVGADSQCLPSCNLYLPRCAEGEVCFKLTYAGDTSLVFENEGPLGVCYPPQQGLRELREPCARTPNGSNCQVNLVCMPETAQVNLCRAFCNPDLSGACPVTEHCQSFVGDWSGRRFGVCLPNNGFGDACARDAQCKPGLSCQPFDDPAAWTNLSTLCQFNVGAQPGLAPCAPRLLGDGGVLSADRACQSGACRGEGLSGGPDFQCFAACQHDSDCAVGGRTGYCDGTFSFTTPGGSSGTVKGCRPACAAERDCAAWDAGVACHVRAQSGALHATCGPTPGAARGGAPCTSSAECRSGLCQLADARFVGRLGTCLEPCRAAADCQDPLALVPQTCGPVTVALGVGPDQTPRTADDVLATIPACVGVGCTSDRDCAPDGGAGRCVPAFPGSDGGLALRCQAPAPGGALEGGQPCVADGQCVSGVCGALGPPSAATGRACFQACGACPGTTTCRAGGMRVAVAGGEVSVDTCAP